MAACVGSQPACARRRRAGVGLAAGACSRGAGTLKAQVACDVRHVGRQLRLDQQDTIKV
jgi:hypothetical protein